MSSWLQTQRDTNTYYGSKRFLRNPGVGVTSDPVGVRINHRESKIHSFMTHYALNLRVLGSVAAILSMLYGAHHGATTSETYFETAQHAFSSASVTISDVLNQLIMISGMSNNPTLTLVVEFLTVMPALLIAIFAGIGAAIAVFCQALFFG